MGSVSDTHVASNGEQDRIATMRMDGAIPVLSRSPALHPLGSCGPQTAPSSYGSTRHGLPHGRPRLRAVLGKAWLGRRRSDPLQAELATPATVRGLDMRPRNLLLVAIAASMAACAGVTSPPSPQATRPSHPASGSPFASQAGASPSSSASKLTFALVAEHELEVAGYISQARTGISTCPVDPRSSFSAQTSRSCGDGGSPGPAPVRPNFIRDPGDPTSAIGGVAFGPGPGRCTWSRPGTSESSASAHRACRRSSGGRPGRETGSSPTRSGSRSPMLAKCLWSTTRATTSRYLPMMAHTSGRSVTKAAGPGAAGHRQHPDRS